MSRIGKPYSCGICGKALDRRQKDLTFHSVIHSGHTSVIEKEYEQNQHILYLYFSGDTVVDLIIIINNYNYNFN